MIDAEYAIRRMTAVFGDPKTDDPDVFLDEYRRALSGWDANVLEKATDRVIQASVFWPKPAEFLVHARAVAAEAARFKPRKPAEHETGDLPVRTQEQIAAATELVAQLVRSFAAKRIDRADDRVHIDWKRGQRPPRRPGLTPASRRMAGEGE